MGFLHELRKFLRVSKQRWLLPIILMMLLLGGIVANLSLVLSGLLAGFLLAEIVLKMVGFSFPRFHRDDMYAGFRLLEGAGGWFRTEGESHVRINGQSMRDDREITEQKAQGVYRIAVLGDSFAQAMQLPVEKSFWRVLEGKLNECRPFGKRKVEILNFGVAAYSTAQQLQTLRHRVWQFQPDMVLLAFYSGHNVQDNSRQLAGYRSRPFFVYRNDLLVLDDSFLELPRYKLGSISPWLMFQIFSQYSSVAQLVNKVRDMAWQSVRVPLSNADKDAAGREAELHDYERIYLPPRENTDFENAWRVSEGLIVQMRNEVAARGAEFVVVTLSTGMQVHPDRGTRTEYARHLGVADLFYPETRIKALGEREGLYVISLAEPFQKYAEEHRVYLHGFPNSGMGIGHWNENGHGLAGRMISECLCQMDFLRRPANNRL